jgi:hypothetical protein
MSVKSSLRKTVSSQPLRVKPSRTADSSCLGYVTSSVKFRGPKSSCGVSVSTRTTLGLLPHSSPGVAEMKPASSAILATRPNSRASGSVMRYSPGCTVSIATSELAATGMAYPRSSTTKSHCTRGLFITWIVMRERESFRVRGSRDGSFSVRSFDTIGLGSRARARAREGLGMRTQ